jgi:hypothetical protein
MSLHTAHPLGDVVPVVGLPDASVAGIPPVMCGFGGEVGVSSGKAKQSIEADTCASRMDAYVECTFSVESK